MELQPGINFVTVFFPFFKTKNLELHSFNHLCHVTVHVIAIHLRTKFATCMVAAAKRVAWETPLCGSYLTVYVLSQGVKSLK